MLDNLKNIHVGRLIRQRMLECAIDMERASNFLKESEDSIDRMFESKSLDSNTLLLWSKLLEYDFFRIYTQHLILYAPQDINKVERKKKMTTVLPVFKKNIYTQEIIYFLVELIETGEKSVKQIQEEYNIPSTTILRWRDKYRNRIMSNNLPE